MPETVGSIEKLKYLFDAVVHDSAEIVQELISWGAEASGQDLVTGLTPLMAAAYSSNPPICTLLISLDHRR